MYRPRHQCPWYSQPLLWCQSAALMDCTGTAPVWSHAKPRRSLRNLLPPTCCVPGRHSTRWTNSSCKSGNCNSNVSERSNCSSNICSRSGHHPGADRFLSESLMLKIVYDVLVVTPHREHAPAVLNLRNCSASLRALAVQRMASSYKARSHLPEPSERSFPSGCAGLPGQHAG